MCDVYDDAYFPLGENVPKKDEILMPSKGEKVTRKEYDEIVKFKMEEMKSMYQSRSRKGGRKF